MGETLEQNTPFITAGGLGGNKMREHDASVLVALPPTDRRGQLVGLLRENGFGVVTADDGIEAVDAVRDVDVVLVGGYPERITAAVVNATTPPGVSRPNVLLEAASEESADATDDVTGTAGGVEPTASVPTEPDTRMPATATNEAVADAVERAVARSAYREHVSKFSAVAAEAANTNHGSHQLATRATMLAEEARRFQDAFSPSDWTATFRSMADSSTGGDRDSRSSDRPRPGEHPFTGSR